jgi:hypothetical protein
MTFDASNSSTSACTWSVTVAFTTAPPKRSQYGLTSVPPPANPSRNGADASCFIGLFCQYQDLQDYGFSGYMFFVCI